MRSRTATQMKPTFVVFARPIAALHAVIVAAAAFSTQILATAGACALLSALLARDASTTSASVQNLI